MGLADGQAWEKDYPPEIWGKSDKPVPAYHPLKSDQEFKADGGKSNPLLLEQGFANALEHVNATLDYGAIKYEAHSWRNVPNGIQRYDAAARRHRRARDKNEYADPESFLSHRAHEIVCLLMAFELELDAMFATGMDTTELLKFNRNPPQDHKKHE